MLNRQNILITGATGTLGKALVKHILDHYSPRRLIVFSRDEHKQNNMAQEFDNECLRFFIGDIRDKDRLRRAFQDVDYVIHCAALKHVNQAEYDCQEYVMTNVYGTQNVIDAAIDNEVGKVILVSTDKAVNPISLYGSTKLCAEKMFVAANNLVGKRKTRFSVVRLGNIWGSRGSVIPYYKKLVEQGAEYLPVTDPAMTRFFIEAKDAAISVVKSFKMMYGGETIVPKMRSAFITTIVEAFGKRPVIIGMRPGEKLYEIACPNELTNIILDFGDVYIIKPTVKLVHNYNYETYENSEFNIYGEIVAPDFQYTSQFNEFLTVEEIRQMIREAQ